jgi:hypothetical protein
MARQTKMERAAAQTTAQVTTAQARDAYQGVSDDGRAQTTDAGRQIKSR